MITDQPTGELLPARSSGVLFTRLSIMMFLQYFVQGCYLPIAALYVEQALGFTDRQKGAFIAALAVGPILAPFVIGQLVDRAFSTERVMAFCHLVGGGLMLALYFQTGFWPVIVLGTVYSIMYVPTMMLSNSLAFQHLRSSEMEFPWIRLCGTIGFIAPAFLIEPVLLRGLTGTALEEARGVSFALSGIFGLVMGIYCLTLPHTPPVRDEKHKYAPGVVMDMLRQRNFLVIVLVTFLICIAHQYFFVFNSPFLNEILRSGGVETARELQISSIGQWCEIGVMAILGFVLTRIGYKWTLVLGATAYMLRCLLFSAVFGLDLPFAGKLALALSGQALHGFCFGFFLAVGYMYVDRISPRDVRGSMQNIYGVFFVSIGFFVGGLFGGEVGEWFTTQVDGVDVRNWTGIWMSSAALCAVCVVILIAFFPRSNVPKEILTINFKQGLEKPVRPRQEVVPATALGLGAVVLPVVACLAVNRAFPGWLWQNEPLHAVTVATGAYSIVTLAVLLLLMRVGKVPTWRATLCASGLASMGILEVCHACVEPSNEFVWLHCLSTLTGGIFFGLLWIPIRVPSAKLGYGLPIFAAVIAVLTGIGSIAWPDFVPAMIADGEFTASAEVMTFVASIGFVMGAGCFRHSFRNRQGDFVQDFLLGGFCLFVAVSGFTFHASILWDAAWWLWHVFDLLACFLAFAYTLALFLRSRREVDESHQALSRRADELQREVADRKQAEASLRELAGDLKRSNDDLDQFAHAISHDLRAPLRRISALAEWIMSDYERELGGEGRENLLLLVGQSQRMAVLIDGVLRYSRAGHQAQEMEPVDVGELIQNVVFSLAPPPHVTIDFDESLPNVVYDPTQLQQVFQNLISNAVNHLDKPSGEILISVRDADPYFEFCVRDNGPGIPQNDQERIFQLFQTLHSNDEESVSGVGLSITKRIVERHGGSIWVESLPGDGSRFRFTIPKHPHDEMVKNC